MRSAVLFYHLLLALVSVPLLLRASPADPSAAFFVVVDSEGNVVTGRVRLSVEGLPVYRLNSTHLYAPLDSERVVRLSVVSWGVVVYSAEVEVRPGFTYEVRVPVADLEVSAPPGCRVTVTVLRSNRSATVEGNGVLGAVPLGLVGVRVECGGRTWEDVYDFTGGRVSVRENLSVEYSPVGLVLLALSALPTVAYLAAVKVREARERRIPKPSEYGVGGETPPEKGEGQAERWEEASRETPVIEAQAETGSSEDETISGVEEPSVTEPLESLDLDDFTLREMLERVRA